MRPPYLRTLEITVPKDQWKSSRVRQQLKRLSPLPDLKSEFSKNYRECGDGLIYVGKRKPEKKQSGWYADIKPADNSTTSDNGRQLHCDDMWVGVVPHGIHGVKVIVNRQAMSMLDTMAIDGVPVEIGPTTDYDDQPVFKVMS